MNKKKIFYIFLPMVLILILVVYFLFFFPRKPVEWTAENSLHPVPAPRISDAAEVESLVDAVDYSLKYFDRIEKETGTEQPQSRMVSFGKEQVPISHIKESLLDFKAQLLRYGLTPEFFQYVSRNYRFYRSAAKNEVLFTGYYEADLMGSLTPSEIYRYPLYRTPGDLYRVDLQEFYFFKQMKKLPRVLRGRFSNDNSGSRIIVPYYTREEIDYGQKLAGKGLEIVWIDSLIDVFFLHIQGSGIVTLDSGKILNVNYDESNGHPYVAIGQVLLQQGHLAPGNVSMQSIQAYLRDHPEKVKEILTTNPSYVFFKIVDKGPLGTFKVPLTPFRSIAIDEYLFPIGGVYYIETQLPIFDGQNKVAAWKSFKGFVLNQDTGGAIRGPGRVDLFTGNGEKSRMIAGHMKQKGTFYFLIKK